MIEKITGAAQNTRWYLCGPMSGIPQFNYPLFDGAAKELRELNYNIVSPSELSHAHVREAVLLSPDGQPLPAEFGNYASFLTCGINTMLTTCFGLILLPGWEKSCGARIEVYAGLLLGKSFRLFSWVIGDEQAELYLVDASVADIAITLKDNFL